MAPTSTVEGLSPEQFELSYGPNGPARRAARDLYRRLASTTPTDSLAQRARWLESLLDWLMRSHRVYPMAGVEATVDDSRTARWQFLLHVLAREPALQRHLQSVVDSLLRDGSAVRLLCSTGLPSKFGLFTELASRLAFALLPEPPDDADLARPLLHAFRKDASREWLGTLSPQLLARAPELLVGAEGRAAIERQRRRAMAIIAARVAALGVAEDVMRRVTDVGPFLKLGSLLAEDVVELDLAAIRQTALRCAQACRQVRSDLEQFGVSTDLVFRLESLQQGLERLRALMDEATPVATLLAAVLTDAKRQQSVRAVIGSSARQLARRIVERSGSTGEHYITETRGEWFAMLATSAGGGVVTAGATFLKYLAGWLALPLFFEGAAFSLNYAAGFLLMQVLGFTLATKQPSMTAAVLTRALEQDRGTGHHDRVVELVAKMVRSQLAALIGNLAFVVPAVWLANWAHLQLVGHSFFDAYAAQYAIDSLHPLHSGTLLFATWTGILLWFSSVCAGWLDNWVAYHRLPAAVSQHPRLHRWLGVRFSRWLGAAIGRAASPVAACVSLGFLLGMTPFVGKIFGVPLDVRHVTFSMAGLTLAVSSVGLGAAGPLGAALVGVGLVGLLNFTVSFTLAFFVAMRAGDLPLRGHLQLARALGAAFLSQPFKFFFPPRPPKPAEPAAPPG